MRSRYDLRRQARIFSLANDAARGEPLREILGVGTEFLTQREPNIDDWDYPGYVSLETLMLARIGLKTRKMECFWLTGLAPPIAACPAAPKANRTPGKPAAARRRDRSPSQRKLRPPERPPRAIRTMRTTAARCHTRSTSSPESKGPMDVVSKGQWCGYKRCDYAVVLTTISPQ